MIEAYSLEKVAEEELTTIEEHLLVCSGCQDRLIAADTYVVALRAALTQRES
jgi:hypothetical protein